MTELGNVNYSYYIPNDTNIAKYNKMPSFKDYFNDSHDSFEKTTISNATDSNDDGKISYEEKIKCFVKGLVSPITSMFSSPKNFITGAAMILGGAALIAATGGAAAPLLVAAGVLTGGLQIGKGLYKASTAQTDEEAKEAWNEMGSGTSFVGLSVLGAKSSVAQAETAGVKVSPNAKNLNAFEATIECFKSVPSSISKSFSEITNNSGKNFSEFFSKVGVTDKKSKPKVNSDEKPDSKPQNSSNNAGSQERKVPPEKPNK